MIWLSPKKGKCAQGSIYLNEDDTKLLKFIGELGCTKQHASYSCTHLTSFPVKLHIALRCLYFLKSPSDQVYWLLLSPKSLLWVLEVFS